LGCGDGGSSGARDEGESTAGSADSCAANNSLCEWFSDWDGSNSEVGLISV